MLYIYGIGLFSYLAGFLVPFTSASTPYASFEALAMSKADNFLRICQEHLNEWVCSNHNTDSNQPAAIFREVKRLGYSFEEVRPNRWGKKKYCPVCEQETTHYKLLSSDPVVDAKGRFPISPTLRNKILKLLENRDAFTGASITSTAEIDHKVPWTRLEQDIDINTLSDDEIKEHFQLLTREHNLLKDRACSHCKQYGVRLPLFEIPFWYIGNQEYTGFCEGCGWHDGKRWKEELSARLLANEI